MSRFVLIDDTNPSIQYSGPWFEVNNTQIDTGTYGPPSSFQNTSHGVNVTANFSFSFSGTTLLVYGTSITTNGSEQEATTWDCFIDGVVIESPTAVPSSGNEFNNWVLCGAFNFIDGPHLLTVNAKVSNQQTFWFNQIQYVPSASLPLNQSLLRIDSSDLEIQYGSGWQSLLQLNELGYDIVNVSYTQINGTSLTYQFSGTSITWVGITEPVDNRTIASATYTIDDQDPISVPVPVSSNSDNYAYNQILFGTGELSFGEHKLVVTYFGNSTAAPLALEYLVQQNGTSSASSNTSTSTSVPSGGLPNSSPSSSTTIHKSTEAIIGGVIGGLVFISLLSAPFFFNRRRNNQKSQALSEMSDTVPFSDVVTPFTDPSLNPTSAFLSQHCTSDGHFLPSQSISSKFTQRGQPSDPASMSSSSSGIPPLTLLQPGVSRASPVFITPSSSALPLTGSQTNLDTTRTSVPQIAMEPSVHRSPSPQGANVRFVRHNDSGVRIPFAENDVDELPPFYTPG